MHAHYLMSPPRPDWALRGRANFKSREAPQVDAAAARREWLALARALEARGGTVLALPSPDPLLTGMPYAAECGFVVPRPGDRPLFLLPRMASAHRRPEAAHWAGLARALGMAPVELEAGVWEAFGDVAHFRGVTLLFHGGRTTREGLEAAARHVPGEVLRLEVREPAFHGNMALLALDAADRLVVCREVMARASQDALEARFGREALLEVSEEEIRRYATNGLPVGRDVLAPDILAPRVRALLEGAGMRVVPLALRELCEKGGGASRCLASVFHLPTALDVPEAYRLDTVARDIR